MALDYLEIDTLEEILPSVYEEYGADRKCDLKISINHKLISEHLEGVKFDGFKIDKNGNIQLTLNLAAKLLI